MGTLGKTLGLVATHSLIPQNPPSFDSPLWITFPYNRTVVLFPRFKLTTVDNSVDCGDKSGDKSVDNKISPCEKPRRLR